LDSDDDEHDDLLTNIAPIFGNHGKTRRDVKPKFEVVTPGASTGASSSEVLTLLGTTSSFMLGKTGGVAIGDGDELVLVREVDPAYHGVVVRAKNAQGQRVGFVMASESSGLGTIIQKMHDKLKFTATVVGEGAGQCPISVNFFARAQHRLSNFEKQPLEDSIRKYLKHIPFQRAVKSEVAGVGGAARRVTTSPVPPPSNGGSKKPVPSSQSTDAVKVMLGTCDFTVVGTQYYSGSASTGDILRMVREPNNASISEILLCCAVVRRLEQC